MRSTTETLIDAAREAADRLTELERIADKRGVALEQINLLVAGYLSGHPGHRTMGTIRDIIAEVGL